MPNANKPLRQSVSLSPRVARRVRALARLKKASASRVIAELVESGLETQDAERTRFLELAGRLRRSTDPAEQKRIKEDLAHLTLAVREWCSPS